MTRRSADEERRVAGPCTIAVLFAVCRQWWQPRCISMLRFWWGWTTGRPRRGLIPEPCLAPMHLARGRWTCFLGKRRIATVIYRPSRTPSASMALRELPLRTVSVLCRDARPALHAIRPAVGRNASSEASSDVESASSFSVPVPSADVVRDFNVLERSKARRQGKKALPPSRYDEMPW